MRKASKWIRNFLFKVKKDEEEKDKKKDVSFSAESSAATPTDKLLESTPTKEKRRWSFRRSNSAETSSSSSSKLVKKALLEYNYDNGQNHFIGVATHEDTKTIIATNKPSPTAAATKIQANFRSYLARRALIALRGLVKLQALVRGHLVRKRTTATLRCMHALIAIQFRARVQRIQMAEETQPPHPPRRRTTQRELAQENQYGKKAYTEETKVVNVNETGAGSLKSKRVHPQIERIEPELRSHFAGRLSISKREDQLQICPNPPLALDEMVSSRASHNSQLGEYYSVTPTKSCSPYHYSSNSTMAETNNPYQARRSPFAIPLPEYVDHFSHDCPWFPSYMANTESSRAKARSHSEPKQRPKQSTKQKSSRSTSSELVDIVQDIHMQSSYSQVRRPTNTQAQKNQYHPWLIKLYRSTGRSIKDKDRKCNTISTTTDCKSLIGYEPPVNLY